ncbi:MAG: hypothetical protein D5R97_09785, partial [Candidatus Syntrophonatronum acetioxidans]
EHIKKLAWLPLDWGVNNSLRKIGVPAGYISVLTAELLYEWNDLDRALPFLLEGLNEAEEENCLEVFIPALITLARIKRARGSLEGALKAVEKGCRKVRETKYKQWLPLLSAFKVQLLLSRGEREECQRWKENNHLSIYGRLIPARELEYFTLARVLMDQGNYEDALVLLARLHLLAEREGRLYTMIDIFNLQSLAYFEQGETQKAMEALEKSLLLAEPLGYLRKFIDQGRPMLSLLVKFLPWQKKYTSNKKEVSSCFVQKLIRKTREGIILWSGKEKHRDIFSFSGEKLTRRELEVLRFLDQELSNVEISCRLAIALPTVKAHISSIFSKLGVNNRAAAAKQAREMDIL